MASFLSEAEKIEMASQFDNLHDTFAGNVVIYKTPKINNIVTNNDYISIYRNAGQGENLTFSYETVSGVFPMRVNWINPNEEKNIPTEIDMPNQICRLKMRKDAFDFLSGYQSVFVDGVACELIPGYKPHGLFGVDFYTIYVKRRGME